MITAVEFWLVLVASAIVYWLLPTRFRIRFMAISSFAYLLTVDSTSVLILAIWAHVFYFLGPRAAQHEGGGRITAFLILSVLTCLAYFKYVPQFVSAFTSEPILHRFGIPLGISYFTFKLIHYAIEAGRGGFPNATLEKFYCYLFLFPIYSAGPIERFDNFLEFKLTGSIQDIVTGLTRIAHGLIKRFVICPFVILPLFGYVSDGHELQQRLGDISSLGVWRFCILSFLFVYIEFSAYSDIAIGASRLFGFRIIENFNWPIFATNVSMFWKRWHISLTNWCQTYIYMTMIGHTRNIYLSTFTTFLAIGLWHSGSLCWVLWGLYHAIGVSVFAFWSSVKRKHRWKGTVRLEWRLCGLPITFMFVSAGAGLVSLDATTGLIEICQYFSKLLFLS